MGLFKGKKAQHQTPIDESTDGVQRFFDEYFKELRSRGREYFEKTVEENATDFKHDLKATVVQANIDLKDHIADQLEKQAVENNKILQDSQQAALQSMSQSVQELQHQHQQLTEALQKNVAAQQAIIGDTFEATNAQIAAMKDKHGSAVEILEQSVEAMKKQHEQLDQVLQNNAAAQGEILIKSFEENMARIIEHYLLGALGDQYDMKAQLPAIIKQMEENKQAIVDDMKL